MTYRMTSDGKKVSLLGYGAMRLPTVDGGHANGWAPGASKAAIDQARVNRQVREMLDSGITYFDTSPAYCRGESERVLGAALKASGYPREAYAIATKLSNFASEQQTRAASQAMFARSLAELQVDYIDNYLLHSIGNGGFKTFEKRYLSNGILEWLCQLRAERKIRNLGFSFHGDRKAFDWCLDHHDTYKWDFCQIQMNYVDWEHASEVNSRNVNAKELYEVLRAKNIPVVVMEPLLGGNLARYNWAISNVLKPLCPTASLATWALRFCGSFDGVLTVLSGMTYEEHIRENCATFSPLLHLSPPEYAALDRAACAYLGQNTIPCNVCNYCMPCPYGLDIPALLTFRNRVRTSEATLTSAEVLALYRRMIPEELRRADHCTGCGRCLNHCPQAIDIPRELAGIDAWIDGLKLESAS